MSTRNDKLRALASKCRASHAAALVVVGHYAAAASDSELDALLGAVDDVVEAWTPASHLEAYRERWGRLPG